MVAVIQDKAPPPFHYIPIKRKSLLKLKGFKNREDASPRTCFTAQHLVWLNKHRHLCHSETTGRNIQLTSLTYHFIAKETEAGRHWRNCSKVSVSTLPALPGKAHEREVRKLRQITERKWIRPIKPRGTGPRGISTPRGLVPDSGDHPHRKSRGE